MAIQHRRGADVDFKAEKMLPGEIAVTTDGTRKVYAAFAPGDVKELASKEEVQKIVDDFENSVDEKINEAVQQVTDEATEQVEGIVAKGEEILNSIPADYQETVKEVAKLKEDLASTTQSKADAIICETEGTTIVATDSSDAGFEGLSLYGKSKQGSTTGAQLFDASTAVSGLISTENGKATNSTWWMRSDFISVSPLNDYCISQSTTVYFQYNVAFYDESKKYISGIAEGKANTTKWTFQTPENAKYMRMSYSVIVDNTAVDRGNIMLNAGSEALPWEPYTGGKPSPNPEYLQEVVSVGNGGSIDGKVCGKNLLKNTATTQTINGVTFTVNDDDSVTINGTATANASLNITNRMKWNIGSCILSGNTISYDINNFRLGFSTSDYKITYDDNTKGALLDLSNVEGFVFAEVRAGYTVNNLTIYPMIRLASIEDDTYEPYKEQTITLQTPNGLPGNKVMDDSLATYTDADGQMWCADEKNYERGVYVKRILVHTVNNVNPARIVSTSNGLKWSYGDNVTDSALHNKMNGAHASVMCDKFTLVAQQYENDESTGTCVSAYGHSDNLEFRFRLLKSEYPTEEDVINAISGTKVYYPLATPIETPLPDEEIAAYKSLHTNKPTTVITNSENAYMKAKYVADTITHIKQNYIPLSKYTALEERVAAIEELVIS